MPSATILIADGSEEIEFVTIYDVLVRAGFDVKSVGVDLKNNYVNCSRNIKLVPDSTTIPSKPESTILLLPGGAPGAKAFCKNGSVLALIRAYRDAGHYVGFICAATTALVASVADAGKTEGLDSAKKCLVTSHPSVKKEIIEAGWEYSEDRVVVDKKVVTSRGPGTAGEWALKIVELLLDKDKREEVSGPMLYPGDI